MFARLAGLRPAVACAREIAFEEVVSIQQELEERSMETGRVDLGRLQNLSDCINRTIDVLNQVRLSVHGGNLPFGLQATGAPSLAANPGAFAIAPQLMGQVPGVLSGMAHSAPAPFYNQLAGVTPWAGLAQWPNIAQAALANTPWNNNAWANAGLNGAAAASFGQFGQTGLGHTGLDPRVDQTWGNQFVDSYATARIAQTFPFLNRAYSPFAWPSF
jgi:hypothetical protein